MWRERVLVRARCPLRSLFSSQVCKRASGTRRHVSLSPVLSAAPSGECFIARPRLHGDTETRSWPLFGFSSSCSVVESVQASGAVRDEQVTCADYDFT